MQITADNLASIAGRSVNDNMRSTIAGLAQAGVSAGLHLPHRLAQYLAQIAHESGGWRFDQEIWGPSAAQRRYEGRADLGNTQAGDGYRFRGRGPIQITGRDNYRQFTAWARKVDPAAPDFERDPDAVNTDPWEGLVPIWYWETRSLNRYADNGDLLSITKRINGGTNGLSDRQTQYTRAALVLLGYAPADVRAFQRSHGLSVDGIAGPATRARLHAELAKRPPVAFGAITRPAPKPTTPPPTSHQLPTAAAHLPLWLLLLAGVIAVTIITQLG